MAFTEERMRTSGRFCRSAGLLICAVWWSSGDFFRFVHTGWRGCGVPCRMAHSQNRHRNTPRRAQQEDLSLETVQLGQELIGRVTEIDGNHAYVDYGLDFQGYIHVSQTTRAQQEIIMIREIFQEGQKCKARVKDILRRRYMVILTQLELDMMTKRPLSELRAGDVFTGTVKRQFKNLYFLDIGAQKDAAITVMDAGRSLKAGEVVEVQIKEARNDQIWLMLAS
eukprot:TRINITY_DN82081_c0_g1_i1.p1 TRINITY_DN82081_c0_g1~~TRINITY_DN82081_c0_g1_i1.p1  ORF type:complete len:224 (-),score=30.01 TRINITY_DN82081_c0_g1_i1:42-713(-)